MTYFSKKIRLSNLGSFSVKTHITNPKREINPNNFNMFSFSDILTTRRYSLLAPYEDLF